MLCAKTSRILPFFRRARVNPVGKVFWLLLGAVYGSSHGRKITLMRAKNPCLLPVSPLSIPSLPACCQLIAHPVGYKVVRVPLKEGKVTGPAEDFATGWLQDNGSATGRPTGATVAPDGSLFVSDDTRNVIYHIWHRG